MPVNLPADRWFNLYWVSLGIAVLSVWIVLLSGVIWPIMCLTVTLAIYAIFVMYQQAIKQTACVVELKSYDQWQYHLETTVKAAPKPLMLENYWQFPQWIFLRLKSPEQTFFMLLRRSIIGSADFSRIVTAIKQHETQ
ncbi:hypothetical protein [Marinicella sp. W31]|uniref:hypothetical protein n=1 Tax=Marinicella sp. W31 TaxID=3023713 RepID=UPI00375837E1